MYCKSKSEMIPNSIFEIVYTSDEGIKKSSISLKYVALLLHS